MQKRQLLYVVLLGVLSTLVTIAFFLPASWVGLALEKQSKGRVTLGDIQGSFWSGSAFVGVAADHYSAVTPLFPGRFS
ncbi:MAG: type II secretion system protein N, partial [Burkholderiales bacterium]|nr:type II secretion system protein N [Burkholderiales bacterium]